MSQALRFRELTLRDFRGIRSATLDLSSDVILLYGRNGTGKTTVFDAIEYALFRSVRRLARIDPVNWQTWLPNIYSRDGFSIALRMSDGTTYPPETGLAPEAIHGDTPAAALAVDLESRDGGRPDGETGPELQHLLLATHLLSQSHLQELVGESSLNTKSLATLTGLGYLYDYYERLSEVEAELDKQHSLAVQAAQTLRCQLDDLTSIRREPTRGNELGLRIMAIAQATGVVVAAVEDHRSLLEHVAELMRQQVANSHRRVAELETMLLGPAEPSDLLESTTKRYNALKQRRDELFEKRDELDGRRNALDGDFAAADNRYRTTSELAEVLYRYQTDRILEAQRAAEVNSVDSRLASDQEVLSGLTKDYDTLTAEIQQQARSLTDLRERHASLAARLKLLRERFRSLDEAEAELAKARAEGDLASMTHGHEAYEQAISTLQIAYSEFREEPATDGETESICPLCGSAFLNHETLATAIGRTTERRARLEGDHAPDARRASPAAGSFDAIPPLVHRRIHAAEVAVAQELARLSAYLAPDETSDRVQSDISASLTSLTDEIAKAEAFEARLMAKVDVLNRKRARIEAQVDENQRIRASLDAALMDIRRALTRSAQKLEVSDPLADLEERMRGQTQSLASASRKREDILNAQRVLLEDEALVMRELAAVESARMSMEVALAEIQNSAQQRGDRLRALGIDPATPVAQLHRVKSRTQDELVVLHAGLDELSEIAIDLVRSHDDIADRTETLRETTEALDVSAKHLATLEEAMDRVRGWRATFLSRVKGGIRLFLEPAQKSINAWFASLVPDAARFEGIAIDQASPGLALGLRFRNVPLSSGAPDNFLSAAQLSVLSASIFLTFAERQQWSRLDVVMMDDPVQNLDNLDSLALLDGLREFVRVTGKQLIISTCDQNLYRLMIQKFDRKWRGSARTLAAIRLEYDVKNGVCFTYDVGRPRRQSPS